MQKKYKDKLEIKMIYFLYGKGWEEEGEWEQGSKIDEKLANHLYWISS